MRFAKAITPALGIFAAISFAGFARPALPAESSRAACTGLFKGAKPTQAQVESVLASHREWLEVRGRGSKGKFFEAKKANLCEANLTGIQLPKVHLREVNLSRTNLKGANLSGATLVVTNLSDANLEDADLSYSVLLATDLSKANLSRAKLIHAELLETNLSNAALALADLSGARLERINLKGSILFGANLAQVIFEPIELPAPTSMTDAHNLWQMTFSHNPEALIRLRNTFKDLGFRQQEREVTYAIKHSTIKNATRFGKLSLGAQVDLYFQFVMFELTTEWGMSPGRALWILFAGIPLFSIPYMFALLWPGKNGVWRIWTEKRVRQDLGSGAPQQLKLKWWLALPVGVYFSMLSAFHIGWRDFNVGSWIQRLQASEYTLGATGWVRTVSGVQSLISVYLLAIWALTYFGRPFE